MNQINPISYFPNPVDGRPVSGGYLYVGQPDTDPEVVVNQKQVYALQENGVTVPIPQPVALSVGGTPVFNGANVTIYVLGDYSIKILTSTLSQVYYVPSSTSLETQLDYLSNYSDIASAVTSIGATPKTLIINQSSSIGVGETVTIPSTLQLMFVREGNITGLGTLAFSTGSLDVVAGEWPIFGDDLTVTGLRTVSPYWFGDGDSGTDYGPEIDKALTCLSNGGHLELGNKTIIINSPVSVTTTARITIDGKGATVQAGANFAFGGLHYDTPIITIQGNEPDLPVISSLYRNFAILTAPFTAKKGDLLTIYRSDVSWGGPGKDYVSSHTVYVDDIDTATNYISWLPELEIDIPVSNAATGLLDKTNVVMRLYNENCDITIGDGVKFVGGITGASVGGEGAYQDGLLLVNGRFRVRSDFYGLASAIRARACDFEYSGNVLGSYEQAQGMGIKVDGPAVAKLSDSRIFNCRHAFQVGGGTIFDVAAFVTNCELGTVRQAANENLIPGQQLGALDLHAGSRDVHVSNSYIYGVHQASGKLRISNTKIVSQAIEPISITIEGTSGPDNGEMYLDNCEVMLPPFLPFYNNVTPPGSGTFSSNTYYAKHADGTGAGTGWKFYARNTKFGVQDKATWPIPTDLFFQVGNQLFSQVVFENCTFDYIECGVRKITINPHITTGEIHWIDNKVFGAGVVIGASTGIGSDFRAAYIDGGLVQNTDTQANSFAASALEIAGDTTAIKVSDVSIQNVIVNTFGTTGGITMNASPSRMVKVLDNTVMFIASSGALAHGIRTNRNQTGPGSSTNFVAHVDGNTVLSVAGTNTITAGIQILGLAASGGVGLPAGEYATGTNVVKTAGTPISVTGSLLTLY